MRENQLIQRFKGQTFLEQSAISMEVAVDYKHRMQIFRKFAKEHKLSLRGQKKLDESFCFFLNSLFEEGNDIGDATKHLAALIDSEPGCTGKDSLPRSRRCLQGWRRLDPGATRPPMPWELIAAIVMKLVQRELIDQALLVLLMFDAYLRPGEALSLRREDLVEPTAQHPFFSLNLHPSDRQESSKVGLSDETILLDSKTTPWMGLLLRHHLSLHRGEMIFRVDYRGLRDAWQGALVDLGLCRTHSVLYQLRHSGPSYDRMVKHRSLLDVKKRGRWLSDSSVRRYEASARLNQEFQKLPKKVQRVAIQAPQQVEQWAQRFFCRRKRKTASSGF